MVRKSRVLLCFLWFPEGPDPRSARAGAIETPLFTSGLGSKTVVFFPQLHAHPWYLWHRNRSKRHQESSLKATSWKVYVFYCSGSVLAAFCTRYGPPLRASGTLWPSKGQGFLESEALDSQKVVSHHVWGPLALQGYRVFSHRGPRAIQKTTI